MNQGKSNNTVSSAALMLVMGILLLIAPQSLMATFVRVAGILIVIYGVYEIINFMKAQDKSYISLILGAFGIIVGFVALGNPYGILDAVPLLLGIVLLVTGIQKLFIAPVMAIPDLIFGAILLICGFGVFSFALRVIGILVIVDAAMNLGAALKK